VTVEGSAPYETEKKLHREQEPIMYKRRQCGIALPHYWKEKKERKKNFGGR
jgi:hypothetical protein